MGSHLSPVLSFGVRFNHGFGLGITVDRYTQQPNLVPNMGASNLRTIASLMNKHTEVNAFLNNNNEQNAQVVSVGLWLYFEFKKGKVNRESK
jgi:hypothetical protein